jgi:hypothetical protein
MALPLRSVKTGDPLAIPARDWNAVLAAARWVQQQQHALGGGAFAGPTPNPVIVRVKNGSDEDVPAGGVLGISEPIFPPSGDTISANTLLQLDLRGVTPTADHRSAFVVTLEPLRKNVVGRAVISGACWVKVNAEGDGADGFGYAYANESTASLKAAPMGVARIIYRPGGTGEKWAIVCIGSNQPVVARVDLVPDGGSAGSNPMNRTYKVRMPGSSVDLATQQSPAYRPHAGRAADASSGLASFDGDGRYERLELAYEGLTKVSC